MNISINVLNVTSTKFSLRGDMIDGVLYQQSLISNPLHFPLIYNNLTKMIYLPTKVVVIFISNTNRVSNTFLSICTLRLK